MEKTIIVRDEENMSSITFQEDSIILEVKKIEPEEDKKATAVTVTVPVLLNGEEITKLTVDDRLFDSTFGITSISITPEKVTLTKDDIE